MGQLTSEKTCTYYELVFNRFTRAQFAMMLCSMAIVHEECFVLLHTAKVNSAVELSRYSLTCVFKLVKIKRKLIYLSCNCAEERLSI